MSPLGFEPGLVCQEYDDASATKPRALSLETLQIFLKGTDFARKCNLVKKFKVFSKITWEVQSTTSEQNPQPLKQKILSLPSEIMEHIYKRTG